MPELLHLAFMTLDLLVYATMFAVVALVVCMVAVALDWMN